jgi:hypothetical protein
MPGLFGRLCLVLAQFEPGMPFLVSEQVAKSARILTKSALIHAGRVVIGMGGDGDTESVQSVAGYILAKRKERVLASELARDVRACRKQPLATIQRFVSPLVAGGWMNPEKEHAGNTVWTVNPVIHDAFRNRAIEEESRRLAAREQFLMEDED